jgi:two-component system sensor histidine kinase RpfC
MLEKGGHSIVMVSDGTEALEALEKSTFDLAIMDMQMPNMGGIEVVQRYRFGVGLNDRMPFIVLSGNATRDAQRECEDAGVEAYLTKPIEVDTLLSKVSRVARMAAKEKETGGADSERHREDNSILNKQRVDALWTLFDGQEAFSTMVNEFLLGTRERITFSRGALKQGSYDRVRETAHDIKGSAGHVGAERLADKAAYLQSASDSTLERSGLELLAGLSAVLREADSAIDQYVEARRQRSRVSE